MLQDYYNQISSENLYKSVKTLSPTDNSRVSCFEGEFDARVLSFSSPTPPEGISADVLMVKIGSQSDFSGLDVKDNFVLIQTTLFPQHLACSQTFQQSAFHARMPSPF